MWISAVEKERQNLRKHMNKAEKGMTQKTAAKKPKKELTAKDISLGDAVKVLSMNLKGTVSSRPTTKVSSSFRWVSSVPRFTSLIWN